MWRSPRPKRLRYNGRPQEAVDVLNKLSGAVEQTAEYLYQRAATVSAMGGNPTEVVALLERAVAADGSHAGALFGLALENDRHGNDTTPATLYERAAAQFPTHVGTLLNLGVLYEDMQQYEQAQQCYRRILDVLPDHPRARLFLKDADASRDMYYDEDAQRRQDRLSQVLGIPVTDFELSVRSRNCLQKMGIMTLGDLTRCSEQELLASKNFGETSLVEIRDMLHSKGLELGQFADQIRERGAGLRPGIASRADEQALLDRPIADLNLSVRARKCMVRLGLTTIGELVRRRATTCLECKNFGVTSLNEVREKLTHAEPQAPRRLMAVECPQVEVRVPRAFGTLRLGRCTHDSCPFASNCITPTPTAARRSTFHTPHGAVETARLHARRHAGARSKGSTVDQVRATGAR